MSEVLLACRGLDVAVAGRTLVRDLSFAAEAGTVTCVLGRNGTGKTLTLHALARLRGVDRGQILLRGRPLAAWPRAAFAREVGLLPQDSEDPFPTSVFDTTLAGRHPHIGFWSTETDADRQIASEALAAVGLAEFQDRAVATLSGGERRRLAIATVLAQDPAVLLLDEPTNHLDPEFAASVLRLLKARASAGRGIVLSVHDAGQAARVADYVLLLLGDGNWLHGPTGEILTSANLTRLYRTAMTEISWEGGRTFIAS